MKVIVKLRKENPLWREYVCKLKEYADVEILLNGHLPKYSDADVLITTNLTSQELQSFPKLKAVFLPKTGIDKIPTDELEHKGITVWNSHANADLIAEHALALALSLLHRIPEFQSDMKNRIWYSDGKNYFWHSLKDMTAGIIGFGHIGKKLLEVIEPIAKHIRVVNKHKVYPHGVDGAENIKSIVSSCDILFVCLPLNDTTKDLFSGAFLQSLSGKYVVNVSRAALFDESELYSLLKDGTIKGYASDVWFTEPNKSSGNMHVLPSTLPFSELSNVVMSPHCATHVAGAKERYISDCTDACIKYLTHNNLI